MPTKSIPYNAIETIFLDAGNTLVSMDFPWLVEELKAFDIECSVCELSRAEAAARPGLSSELVNLKSTENRQTSIFYMQNILDRLDGAGSMTKAEKHRVIEHMLTAVSSSGQSQRLWTYILPGVPKALEILRSMGYSLSVVSNSNGTVENILSDLNLRQYFDHVFDSHIVGYEKPDPLFFRHALETTGSLPGATLHVGDLYHVDVLGAQSAGVHAILLDPFEDWKGYDCERFPDLITMANMLKELLSS